MTAKIKIFVNLPISNLNLRLVALLDCGLMTGVFGEI
jgi:hypothetical protein